MAQEKEGIGMTDIDELLAAIMARETMFSGYSHRGAAKSPETDPRMLRMEVLPENWDLGDDGTPGSLARVIATLQEAMANAPPEHRDSLRIEIESEYETSGVSVDIWYTRMETPEEVAERIAKRKAEAEWSQRAQEDRERRELAKLKAKYEPPKP